jgi:hypothetical protein
MQQEFSCPGFYPRTTAQSEPITINCTDTGFLVGSNALERETLKAAVRPQNQTGSSAIEQIDARISGYQAGENCPMRCTSREATLDNRM